MPFTLCAVEFAGAMGEPAEVVYILMHLKINELQVKGADKAALSDMRATAETLKPMFGEYDKKRKREKWYRKNKPTPYSEFHARALRYI